MGREAPLLEPGSPYNIQFRTSTSDGIAVKLLDLPVKLLLARTRHFRVLAATVLQLTSAQLLNRQIIKFRNALLQSALLRFVLRSTSWLLRNKDLPFGRKTLSLSSWFLEADFNLNSNYCQNPKSTVRLLHVIWKGSLFSSDEKHFCSHGSNMFHVMVISQSLTKFVHFLTNRVAYIAG